MSSEDKISELLDLLSQDNLKVTIHSNNAVEKLSLLLSWMLSEIDEDISVLGSFLSRGILQLFSDLFQKVFNQISASCETNSKLLASLEDVLEILNHISEIRIKSKCTVVLQFGEILLSYINKQSLPFDFRLKVVRYTNLLFESCPTHVKDFLYAKPVFKNNLKQALKSIFVIGDYEFQVGIIECVFRTISKQKRVEGLKALCPQKLLHSILAIKDETFEADCRRVLNAFNSQQGHQQRVFSIPCFGVTLGNLELQKPKDDNYKEFWIDFNASSKRISFYCSQIVDSEDPQETDEDIWETVCILKEYIQEVSSNDDDDDGEIFYVQFTFFPLPIELFPGFTLEKYPFIKILFKDKDATMKAIHEIFSKQKCSIAQNQICLKENEKSFQAKELLPSTSEDLHIGEAPSTTSSQLSTTRSVRKSSVPSDIWCSQNSSDSRHEFGVIKICQQFPNPKSANPACNFKRTDSTPISKTKVSNEMVAKNQPQTQQKIKNSDLQCIEDPAAPCTSNIEERTSQTPKSGKCRALEKNKKAQHKDSIDIKHQTSAFGFSSAEEDNEVIPPTFEIKPSSKDTIQSKKPENPLINSSIISNSKQNKTLSTTKNSGDASFNISSSLRSNQTNDQIVSEVKKKQSEIIGKKIENKSLQNQKNSLQKTDEKPFEKTQLKKDVMDVKSSDINKLTEDSMISLSHAVTLNNACPINKAEYLHVAKAQESFRSQSVSAKNASSDKNISKISTEKNTTASRKGRRLRSFECLDLLPQNYPLPKDKSSVDTSKNISTSKKPNSSTRNITSKHLEEEKIVVIKETQPELSKAEEILHIPETLPQQTYIEEDQPTHEPTSPAKPSIMSKQPIDSGISSGNNSSACLNELLSTILKRSDVSPQQGQGNLSAKPTKSPLSSERKSVSTKDVKTENDSEKTLKTSNSKTYMDNEPNGSNRSVSKEKDEPYQFPNSKVQSLKSEPQVTCCVPVTEDNLSKFNKRVQKSLAKELDERIEKFVKSSWQSVSVSSNSASPLSDDTREKGGGHQTTCLQNDKDSMYDKTNGGKNLVGGNPLPRKNSPEVPAISPSIVNIKEENQLLDQSCKAKTSSEQKENANTEIYEAVKLGSVADFSKDPNGFTNKCQKIEDNCQEKTSSLVFSAEKKSKVDAASKKPPLLKNRSKSLDSAKPSIGKYENKNMGKTCSSPTEKLFQMTPPKRRSFPLKRDKTTTRADENKKGYDPYDFDCSSSVENFHTAGVSPSPCEANTSTVKNKKKNPNLYEDSALSVPQPQISKRKGKLQFNDRKPPLEDSYKFEKDEKKNDEQDVVASPTCIPDSDCDSPQPKKRAKAKSAKSKVIAKSPLPPPKRNCTRTSVRKRKDINYKETSSVDSSISSVSVHEPEPKKKNLPVKKKTTFLHNDTLYSLSENEDQIKDTTSSLGDTSHTQQSEVSWINSKKSNSPKIHVQKTYTIKKQSTYYGSYACIPKRKRSNSPNNNRGNKANKAKKPVNKELPIKESSHNNFLQQDGKTDHNSSLKSFGANSLGRPKKIYSPSHDKENVFSFSSNYQMKKIKQKKKCIKEPFLSDSIEIQRADSFVMFPDESKLNISILEIESDITERRKHRTPSFNKSNISDFELSLPNTEDPKLLIPSAGNDSSIASLNDDPIESIEPMSSPSSKLMPFSSPLTIDDFKSNSDKQEESITSYLEKNQRHKKQKSLSSMSNFSLEEDMSHSTPMKDYDLKFSPLYAGDDYKSKTSFRKTLFSGHKSHDSNDSKKSHDSNDSKKSSILSPIATNAFSFHGNSLEKDVNLCPSPASDKSTDRDSNDDSSSESSSEESTTNASGPYNLLLPSDKSSHFQAGPPVTYKDDSIKNLIGAFSHDIRQSVQTKQQKVSTVVEEIVKSTQKALNKICENDDHNRSEVHLKFNKKIEQVMNKLEESIKAYEEQKTKMLNNLQGEMKDLQKIKDAQHKSLEKLKMINSLYHETLTSDVKSNQAQHQVQNVMKSQMQKLQSKLLDQARQQEMQQMRKQLHKMLL